MKTLINKLQKAFKKVEKDNMNYSKFMELHKEDVENYYYFISEGFNSQKLCKAKDYCKIGLLGSSLLEHNKKVISEFYSKKEKSDYKKIINKKSVKVPFNIKPKEDNKHSHFKNQEEALKAAGFVKLQKSTL